jgi:hypothetical protein
MFASQREHTADPHIVALVELDMQRMRVRIVVAREAIRQRLRELEHPMDRGEQRGVEDVPKTADSQK